MKIELLDDKTVKVLLSKLDMYNLNLTYDEMDYKSPGTKKVLMQLLDEVKKQIKVDMTKGKLFIEAFPYADGGCILYVNLLDGTELSSPSMKKKKTGFDTPIICCLEGINDLSALAIRLASDFSHMILKSTLYLMNKKYYLVLYTYCKMDSKISAIISEYGKLFGKGAVTAAIIFEHGELIIAENAINLLKKALI